MRPNDGLSRFRWRVDAVYKPQRSTLGRLTSPTLDLNSTHRPFDAPTESLMLIASAVTR
jgi:hypothetical protein